MENLKTGDKLEDEVFVGGEC